MRMVDCMFLNFRMDESFLLEQLMRSMGESYDSQDSVARGPATVDGINNMLALLAIQVPANSS